MSAPGQVAREEMKCQVQIAAAVAQGQTSRLPEVVVYTEKRFIFLKAWDESMRFSKGMALMFPNKALQLIGAVSATRSVELWNPCLTFVGADAP